jgi:hypothetical protein
LSNIDHSPLVEAIEAEIARYDVHSVAFSGKPLEKQVELVVKDL